MLNLTDWAIDDYANLSYQEPGTFPDSASPWVVFSPTSISTSSGDSHLVRVTIRVPPTTEPGVYRSAIFVQERPPATPPDFGQHLVYFRFRYTFALYLIVPPVTAKGELVDARLDRRPEGLCLTSEMRNRGLLHLRPRISWSIMDADQRLIASVENKETTVQLPHSRLVLPSMVRQNLPPGRYEVSAEIDFNDGSFIQRVRRVVEIIPDADSLASTWPAGQLSP
jgi:hypothetical protein